MREIQPEKIKEILKMAFIEVNHGQSEEMRKAIIRVRDGERSEIGREVLNLITENALLSGERRIPYCQDTGVAVVYVEIGEEVKTKDIKNLINNAVASAYVDGYMRSSVVSDPLRRKNTGNNTPAVIHFDIVPGDGLKFTIMAKGTGAENMSQMKMLVPAEGIEGVKDFVNRTVRSAGPNACPPFNIGVGIGGTFDTVTWLAKKALLRPFGQRHRDSFYSDLERDLINNINKLGIGPMGFGGDVTALDVRIEYAPCHIGALPVAVNIDCHAHRVKVIVL